MVKRKRDSSIPAQTIRERILDCEGVIQYVFRSPMLLVEALNMATLDLVFKGVSINVGKNDRLAVYGKSVAEAYLCRMWMLRDLTKGEWSEIRRSLLGNEQLGGIGLATSLNTCVHLENGTSTVSAKSMATTVTAILGAVHLDGGDAALLTVMMSLGLTGHPHFAHPFARPLEHRLTRRDILPDDSSMESAAPHLLTPPTAQLAIEL